MYKPEWLPQTSICEILFYQCVYTCIHFRIRVEFGRQASHPGSHWEISVFQRWRPTQAIRVDGPWGGRGQSFGGRGKWPNFRQSGLTESEGGKASDSGEGQWSESHSCTNESSYVCQQSLESSMTYIHYTLKISLHNVGASVMDQWSRIHLQCRRPRRCVFDPWWRIP